MREQLSCACDRCGRPLTDDDLGLTMETAGGVRRAYECDCGAITVAVVRPD